MCSNRSSSSFSAQSVHNNFLDSLDQNISMQLLQGFRTLAFFSTPTNLYIRVQLTFPERYPILSCQCQNAVQWASLPYTTCLEAKQKCLSWVSAEEKNTSYFMYSFTRIKMKTPASLQSIKQFLLVSRSKLVELLLVYSMLYMGLVEPLSQNGSSSGPL